MWWCMYTDVSFGHLYRSELTVDNHCDDMLRDTVSVDTLGQLSYCDSTCHDHPAATRSGGQALSVWMEMYTMV